MIQLFLIVLLATIIRFGLGGLWYMPKSVLGKKWLLSQHYHIADGEKMMQKNSMIAGALITFFSTFILALILTPLTQMSSAMAVSSVVPALILVCLIWAGFIVPILAQRKIYSVHKNYSWLTFWIDAGYELISIGLAAVVLVLML